VLLPFLHSLGLLPIILLGWRARRPRRAPVIPLGPDQVPTDAELNALLREFVDDRDPVHPSARDLVKYLAPEDGLTIVRCADAHMVWKDPKTSKREIRVRQCRSFWCAWCIRKAHARRSRYQYTKLQSIQPQGMDAVRLLNLVAELPLPLHELVRHDEVCMTAWIKAIRKTLAQVYGYKGKKGADASRVCWGSLGAFFNFHALGDEGTPYPKYFPHFDILLSAYKRDGDTIVRLPQKWPEPFARTRAKYRENIRDAFLPIATTGLHQDAVLAAFLRTKFDVYWHVGIPPPKAGEGHTHIRNAGHRVRYSCRPLFALDRCRLDKDENGAPLLRYEPLAKSRKRIIHRVPPGPAFGALRSLKLQLQGRHTHFAMGILVGKAYKRALAISGRPEVVEQPKTGRMLESAYVKDAQGHWQNVDPRELRRY
jgi:hypothetical protein